MGPYNITPEARIAFYKLKAAFIATPVLQYFNLVKPIYLEINTSRFAITSILSQLDI